MIMGETLQPGDLHYPYVPPWDTVDQAAEPEPSTKPAAPKERPGRARNTDRG